MKPNQFIKGQDPAGVVIVPAAPGFERLYLWDEKPDTSLEGKLQRVERQPIIAWAIRHELIRRDGFNEDYINVIPVLVEHSLDNVDARTAIQMPNGVVQEECEGGYFESLLEWVKFRHEESLKGAAT
jgi:hypothetical protein